MSQRTEPEIRGPRGDARAHLDADALARGFEALASPPSSPGRLDQIVSRRENGRRELLGQAELTPDGGMPGDVWLRDHPEKIDAQIAVMRTDIAQLFSNGQDMSLAGDNLIIDLDLSVSNLPTGSLVSVGAAILEVTPEPHDGCVKFRQRFGDAALRLTANPLHRDQRLRGIYMKVTAAGLVSVGDPVRVMKRGMVETAADGR